jgi:hypothetical protein
MMNEEKTSDEVELWVFFIGETSKKLKVKVSEETAKCLEDYLMDGEELKGFFRLDEQNMLINCSKISYICF